MVIDFHAHYLAPEHLTMQATTPEGRVVGSGLRGSGSTAMLEANGFPMGSAATPEGYSNLDLRLEQMAAMGIDMQVLSPPTYMMFLEIAARDAARLDREQNEAIAEAVRRHPTALAGLGVIPYQDAEVAVREIAHLMDELGLLGVQIPTQVTGWNLDDPQLDPVWQALNARDALVFVHPNEVLGRERLDRYYLWNLIGNPTETAVALASLMFGGVIERFPRIRFLAAHGGGSAPYLLGRWEHAARIRPDLAHLSATPRELFKRVYVDSVVHGPGELRYLIEVIGAERILLGTDVPFDMGVADPVALYGANLPGDAVERIRRGHQELVTRSRPSGDAPWQKSSSGAASASL
jgi:aminocarboxymuconate-semialdehyde decarboxylase